MSKSRFEFKLNQNFLNTILPIKINNDPYQMLGAPCGTENLQNDHTLVKYFGKICRPWSFVRVSSILKMCIVPWSDDTQIFVDSKLKLMQYILAYKNDKNDKIMIGILLFLVALLHRLSHFSFVFAHMMCSTPQFGQFCAVICIKNTD